MDYPINEGLAATKQPSLVSPVIERLDSAIRRLEGVLGISELRGESIDGVKPGQPPTKIESISIILSSFTEKINRCANEVEKI